MALGVDAPDLESMIGHDGLRVQWPEARGERKFIGYHHQEFVDVALLMGFNIMMIEAMPNLGHEGKHCIIGSDQTLQNRMDTYLKTYDGVLVSDTHAVAWDYRDQLCYDPNGRTYPIDNFQVREFFIVLRSNHEDTERLRWTLHRAATPETPAQRAARGFGETVAGGGLLGS